MFDQKNAFMERAAALCKAGLVAAGQVICDMKYAVDFLHHRVESEPSV